MRGTREVARSLQAGMRNRGQQGVEMRANPRGHFFGYGNSGKVGTHQSETGKCANWPFCGFVETNFAFLPRETRGKSPGEGGDQLDST